MKSPPKPTISKGPNLSDFIIKQQKANSVPVIHPTTDRLPKWLTTKAPVGKRYFEIERQLKGLGLSTVCQEAKCPNIGECWSDKNGAATATIMIMGDECTRACRFCSVKTSRKPSPLDPEEPVRTAEAIASWNVNYIVITSVDRDDLEDGGSEHFAKTVLSIREKAPSVKLEVLIPDFSGNIEHLKRIVQAKPEVIAHNVETVKRLQKQVRDYRASYTQSLGVLKNIKLVTNSVITKTSLMLGLGETESEVIECLNDLREVGVDCLTLGQYMKPTRNHLKVKEYVKPEKFLEYKNSAEKLGFKYVASGPLVRSSYKAGEFYMNNLLEK